MMAAFIRRLPLPPIRSLRSSFSTFSTSVHSLIPAVLDSNISSSSCASTQNLEQGIGEVPIKVEETCCRMCFFLAKEDKRLLFDTGAVYDMIEPGPKLYFRGTIKNDFYVDYELTVQSDDAIVDSMTISHVDEEVKMKGFEKVFDNIGINQNLVKFLLEEFTEEGFQI